MKPRPDWNRMGPKLPNWFRVRLKRMDSMLCPQFIPPREPNGTEGVTQEIFPHGVWAICRRLPRTGWLHKRWCWRLTDDHGNYRPPDWHTVKLLRWCIALHRRNQHHRIEEQFDAVAASVARDKSSKSREQMMESFADTLRRMCYRRSDRVPVAG